MIMVELPVTKDEHFDTHPSEAVLAEMREDRLSLLAEADAYGKKRNADTADIVVYFGVVKYTD